MAASAPITSGFNDGTSEMDRTNRRKKQSCFLLRAARVQPWAADGRPARASAAGFVHFYLAGVDAPDRAAKGLDFPAPAAADARGGGR